MNQQEGIKPNGIAYAVARKLSETLKPGRYVLVYSTDICPDILLSGQGSWPSGRVR